MGSVKTIRTMSAIAIMGAVFLAPAFAGSKIEEGKKIAFDRKKGNCLACHKIEGGTMPGDMGPPLVGIKKRFKNKKELRSQIWDPTVRNPKTPMPPFGRHQILSEDEIDKIVEYVYSL